MSKQSLLITVSGGSGSGKSTFVNLVEKQCEKDSILILSQDHYYKDLSHLNFESRKEFNFDHPDAIDHELLCRDINKLASGEAIDRPCYNFSTHTREKETVRCFPKQTIILDGIFSLHFDEIAKVSQLKLFLELGDDLRFIRRLLRDIKERGRTMEDVVEQYEKTVRPMHIKFVEPTKKLADLIVLWETINQNSVKLVVSMIKQFHLLP